MPARLSSTEFGAPRREKPVGGIKRFADARKNGKLFLPDAERYLVGLHEDGADDRRQDIIHASEMSKKDWCPRSTYLRIQLARAGALTATAAAAFQLENIWDEGHEYHRKWQGRARGMARLFGTWHCLACDEKWEAVSPLRCRFCRAPEAAIAYDEVHLLDPKNLIIGHADGEIIGKEGTNEEDYLIEVKSIGEGTVRLDYPSLLRRHQVKGVDHRGEEVTILNQRALWKDITRPFASHVKQGRIYLYLRALRKDLPPIRIMDFIYESKMSSATKEFQVERDDDEIGELLALAGDVAYALDGHPNDAPRCIKGDELCKDCKTYEEMGAVRDRNLAQAD